MTDGQAAGVPAGQQLGEAEASQLQRGGREVAKRFVRGKIAFGEDPGFTQLPAQRRCEHMSRLRHRGAYAFSAW